MRIQRWPDEVVAWRSCATAALALWIGAAAVAGRARAQGTGDAPDPSAASATRTVVAGERYRAGAFHRFFLGDDYRTLWATPIDVPVLDVRTYAGGLTPVRRVGGQQTLGLAMKGADGRAYTFRGLDKDPSDILPPEYHDTFVDDIVQDQIASSFPGGSVIVPPFADAAGVLHATPMLVVMPDDPLLGEFRPAFKGVVGTIEEYPSAGDDGTAGTFGATEIITGAEMWKRMDEQADRPDARAFLKARLLDMLLGDWDRHRGQWRWARIPGHTQWQPIPEDRDQAFATFEGVIATAVRPHQRQFVRFDDEYPGIEGLTWNGRDGDRRILVDLEKPVWDDVARELKAGISDAVIAEAISRMPKAYRAVEGPALEAALRSRRDQLPAIADRFYYFLARKVDIRASNQSEIATVTRMENGDVDVTVKPAPDAAVAGERDGFHRLFHPNETEEVRIYLGGGDDSLLTTGPRGKITVRAIGGDGDDLIDDRAGTHLRVSDASGANDVLRSGGTSLDTREYTAPPRTRAEWIPPRDWGRRTLWYPVIAANSDLGFTFLVALQSTGYGYRKDPYASKQKVRVAYATKAGSFGGDYTGEFHRENSDLSPGLYARVSGLDFLHFYGFGNETENVEDEEFYKLKHTEYVFTPSLSRPIARNGKISLLVPLKYSKTDLQADRLITQESPYGTEDFFQAGAGLGLEIDTRESTAPTAGGVILKTDGAVYPPVGGVEETFGEVHGEVNFYQPIHFATIPTLALRAGGKKVWGPYPYTEAAYIGGSTTVRGFHQQRFAGDASLFGSAELRIPIARISFFLPGTFGVFALGDAGRVYFEGESSDKWHTSAGGGLWMSFIVPTNIACLAIAASEEGTRAYLHLGLSY